MSSTNMDETTSFLMEKLRMKSGTFKSFKEYSKSVRMTLLERRYALEVSEKNYLQECLDLLQQNILVSTLPAIIERLEVISRHLGLKFVSGHSALEWFISSDMFYVEVILESNGDIKDVKIHHEGKVEQQNCEELKTTLENRDFKDFTLQLEGLISIYNLNAEKKVKSKAFSSLQYLEADIAQLSELQYLCMKDPFHIIHKSDVGLVQRRRGGHPMKIIYFISPYDLLDITKKTSKPLTLDLPEVDYSVSLCLESSSTNKLQTQPLVKVIKSEKVDENMESHKPNHIFEELTTSNTNLLPACFVMKLKERMPICESLIEQMKEITDIDVNKLEGPLPILSLIKKEIHKKFVECDEDSSVVTLPDQRHCYVMTENHDLQAYIVQNIPFSHPSHVSRILPLLRQQALFNSFIASCIRPKAAEDTSDKQNSSFEVTYCDSEYTNGFGLKLFGSEDFKDLSSFSEPAQRLIPSDITMFEVIPLSLQQITVSFEHPVDETLITAELDLTDISELHCDISMASEDSNTTSLTNAQECAGRALQRSFSIPATMRALIRLWESQTESSDEEDMNESSTNNDVADLNEKTENDMDTETSKENGECPSMNFDTNVTIRIETSDSGDNSLDGFPSLTNKNDEFSSDDVFDIPNTSSLDLSFDTEIVPTNSSSTYNATEPLPFLESAAANDPTPPLFETKTETIDLMDPFFRSKVAAAVAAAAAATIGEPLNTGPKPRLPSSCEIVIDSSSDSELSNAANKESTSGMETKEPSPASSSSLEFSALTELVADVPLNDKPASNSFEMMESLEDVEQYLKITENKIPKNENSNALTSSILSEFEGKNLAPHSLSITPITSTQSSSANQSTISVPERKHTVEIIPLSSSSASSSAPSLTISAINAKDIISSVADRDKGERKKVRIEKKKKRKHDESPMGPPEKIPAKLSDPSKPVLISKTSSSSSGSSSGGDSTTSPTSPSPNNMRKYTVSPTPTLPLVLMGKVSPNSSGGSVIITTNVSGGSGNSVKPSKSQSLTGSPGQLTSSPKMGVTSSSPKQNITSSPKNVSSSGSAGKPSMSALKSAVTSPSSSTKSNELKSKSHKDSSSREHKEKKSSNNGGSGSGSVGHQSPKTKSSNGKFKQFDQSGSNFTTLQQYDPNLANAMDPKAVLVCAQGKNKKGSLSAIVDKLKSQKHCNEGGVEEGGGGGNGRSTSAAGGMREVKNNVTVIRSEDAKNLVAAAKGSGEYGLKSHEGYSVKSTDGARITFHKTRTKDSGSKSSSSTKNTGTQPGGSGSPKHGLKMSSGNVNSVTLCKKPVTKPLMSGSSSNKMSSVSNLSSSSKHSSKSSSSLSFKSKSNHSPKSSSSHNLDKKVRISKIHSDKSSLFGGLPKRSSPSLQEGGDGEKYKAQPPYPTTALVTNLIKPLDKNFQIPKLSDRNKLSGDGEVKKSEGSGSGGGSEDVSKDVKTADSTSSQVKLLYSSMEEPRVMLNSAKMANAYDMKPPKSTSENSLDAAISASSHPVTSNCSISAAAVQSNDVVKLSL